MLHNLADKRLWLLIISDKREAPNGYNNMRASISEVNVGDFPKVLLKWGEQIQHNNNLPIMKRGLSVQAELKLLNKMELTLFAGIIIVTMEMCGK